MKFESEKIKEQAVALWREAFGDSEEYINFFLDTHSSCVCLTETQNCDLQSMLFLIDGELCGVSAYYLFAACTFKMHRGKGCMAKLLQKAKEYAQQNGKGFIALVPAEEWLFDYYSRFGYQTAFYAKLQPINDEFSFENVTAFNWCKAHTDYIEAESKYFGSAVFEKDNIIFSVFDGDKIKAPIETKNEKYRYGMLLPLDENLAGKIPDNAYIGLTME